MNLVYEEYVKWTQMWNDALEGGLAEGFGMSLEAMREKVTAHKASRIFVKVRYDANGRGKVIVGRSRLGMLPSLKGEQ